MITRETIDAIFSATRVEEVIGDFVNLKKSGANFKGLSPFTDEKSPSFMVSAAKQIWKDFSSGKGGNAVTFLMEHEQYSYPEALKYLAKKYGIEIVEDRQFSKEEKDAQKEKENLFVISKFAKDYFIKQLHDSEEGKNIGLSYFKERGFTPESLEKFELGYSPMQRDAFLQYATKKGYKKEALEKAGLVLLKETGQYDRFRERIIFPIHSFSGRVLGFGARILKSNVKTAKYLNSPESPIYNKSKILYGIYQAKQSIIKNDNCFLVEGYTDVVSLSQKGIENVVASSGTALTSEQIRLIKRLTPNITVIYDGDRAGINASFRGIDLLLKQELNVKVLLLPDGEDPDSFAKNHPTEKLKEYLEKNATDFIQFKTKVLLEDAEGSPTKKAALVQNILESIVLIENLIKRELYVRECAHILKIREEVLFGQLAQIQKAKDNQKQKETSRNNNRPQQKLNIVSSAEAVNSLLILEESLTKLMLQYGTKQVEFKDPFDKENTYENSVIAEIIEQLQADDISFSHSFYLKHFEFFLEGYQKDELRSESFFLSLVDEDISQKTSHLLMEKYTLHNWKRKEVHVKPIEKTISSQVTDCILRYKSLVLEQMIETISKELQTNQNLERTETLQKIIRLTGLKNKINQTLGLAI